jgi:hypothetical protein
MRISMSTTPGLAEYLQDLLATKTASKLIPAVTTENMSTVSTVPEKAEAMTERVEAEVLATVTTPLSTLPNTAKSSAQGAETKSTVEQEQHFFCKNTESVPVPLSATAATTIKPRWQCTGCSAWNKAKRKQCNSCGAGPDPDVILVDADVMLVGTKRLVDWSPTR